MMMRNTLCWQAGLLVCALSLPSADSAASDKTSGADNIVKVDSTLEEILAEILLGGLRKENGAGGPVGERTSTPIRILPVTNVANILFNSKAIRGGRFHIRGCRAVEMVYSIDAQGRLVPYRPRDRDRKSVQRKIAILRDYLYARGMAPFPDPKSPDPTPGDFTGDGRVDLIDLVSQIEWLHKQCFE